MHCSADARLQFFGHYAKIETAGISGQSILAVKNKIMLQKLKLKRSDKFDTWVATLEMTRMVVARLDGRASGKALGSEQGGISEWDDIVIKEADGSWRHVQVKRQQDDFSTDSSTRDRYTKDKRKGELRDLSPFDQAIKSLAEHFKIASPHAARRSFQISTPFDNLFIKKDIKISEISNLCQDCNNPSTTSDGLAARALTDNSSKLLFDWLTTWCGFSDWEHILRALSHLSIHCVGQEDTIKTNIKEALAGWFASTDKTCNQIYHYLHINETDTGAATPRMVSQEIADYLRPDKPRWLQYQHGPDPMNWYVSGTVGCHKIEIEKPHETVPAFWTENHLQRILYLGAAWPTGPLPELYTALLRLTLHLPQATQILLNQTNSWDTGIRQAVGGTLGISGDDLKVLPTPTNSQELRGSSDGRCLSFPDEAEEADALHTAMNIEVWRLVRDEVTAQIQGLPINELKAAMSRLWPKWCELIEGDDALKRSIFLEMVAIPCEGKKCRSVLRLGPKLVTLLADGLITNLVIAIALVGQNAEMKKLQDGRPVKTIALKWWGGPAETTEKARELFSVEDSEDGLKLLGSENDPILIFSGVSAAPNEVFPESFADDAATQHNFSKQKRPDLIVTNCRAFQKAKKDGSIESVKSYLTTELSKSQKSRQTAIEEAIAK